MEWIKVGKIEFSVEHLKDVSLAECQMFFSHIRKDIVKIAWENANVKPKSKKKSND